jgi:hypothetical protein
VAQDQLVAAPRPGGGSRGDDCGGDREALFGNLRDVRTGVQDIGESLDKVKRAFDVVDPAARMNELARTVDEVRRAADRNRGPIDDHLSACRRIFNDCPRLYDEMGDQHARIENDWRRLVDSLPTSDPKKASGS